ncbi:hypothetical protein D3C80_1847100 [compost metagenome]
MDTPALLQTTSRWLYCSRMAATMALTLSSFDTSHCSNIVRAPAASQACTVDLAEASLRL